MAERQTKVREILLYSERIKEEDVRNLFNQLMKSRIPLFGFLDFSDIFSLNVLHSIIKRKLNTVQFFIKDKKSLEELSLLVFPYKISEPTTLERSRGSLLPFPKIYLLSTGYDFLDFMLKESIEEVSLRVIKILGRFIGFGSATDERGKKSVLISVNPEKFLVVDMEKNPSVYIEVLEPIPKRMSVSSKYPVFEETGITVGVDNFDVFQHTLVVGASGTGKSKAIYALVKAIEAKYRDDVRILLVDPHGEFVRMFPEYKIVDLINNYIEPLDVGGAKTPLMTQLIAQLLASAIGQENKYSERVLFYATHLLTSIDKMDLRNISLLLTDSSKRAEFISETENDEVKRFFDEEFNDIYIHHFNDAVLPILNFVGEYELYLGGKKKRENLVDLIRQNRVTVVSFNPNFFGKRMINFLAGAVINQMYILAITERISTPTILVLDEFQRVETRVVRDILAETRKFNLYVYLSMQYLGQISKEVHDSIVSNIRNIVSFKANRQDATMLSSIMEIKIEESFKKSRSQTELEESKKEMFVRLHQRECIVRLFDGKKYILPMKLKVVDTARWGDPVGAGTAGHVNAPVHQQEAPSMHRKHTLSAPSQEPREESAEQGAEHPQPPAQQRGGSADEVQHPQQPEPRGEEWMSLKSDRDIAGEEKSEKRAQEIRSSSLVERIRRIKEKASQVPSAEDGQSEEGQHSGENTAETEGEGEPASDEGAQSDERDAPAQAEERFEKEEARPGDSREQPQEGGQSEEREGQEKEQLDESEDREAQLPEEEVRPEEREEQPLADEEAPLGHADEDSLLPAEEPFKAKKKKAKGAAPAQKKAKKRKAAPAEWSESAAAQAERDLLLEQLRKAKEGHAKAAAKKGGKKK